MAEKKGLQRVIGKGSFQSKSIITDHFDTAQNLFSICPLEGGTEASKVEKVNYEIA